MKGEYGEDTPKKRLNDDESLSRTKSSLNNQAALVVIPSLWRWGNRRLVAITGR